MDKRKIQSRRAIKNAMLNILVSKKFSDISVSEITKEAGIARSTFYMHYESLDQVFEELIDDFAEKIRSLPLQLKCQKCSQISDESTPFCVFVRKNVEYKSLVHDPQFFSFFKKHLREQESTTINDLTSKGIPRNVAEAIFEFQMSGCFAAAQNTPKDANWHEIQKTLDTFISAGLRAIVSASSCPRKP